MPTPRSLLICAAVIAILPAAAAVAQNGRDEGITAFVRGDYVVAARILGPLADDAQSPDQTARLIIGMLNDSGYAGQGGTSRACALYVAAAATPGPFTEPAVVLARMIREELGGGAAFCDGRLLFPLGPSTFRNGATGFSIAADAFLALARGEVDSAAALLKNVAESDSIRDQVAQFLMGTLYQSGRGAPLDPLRACALYHRASITSESPFGAAAMRLMRGLWRAHDNEWFARCQVLANLGFDHRFEPTTIELAPGRSVTWDFTGARLTNQGQTTEFPWRGPRGAAFLPLQHTTLRSGPGQERRDFIELLFWSPSGERWALSWHLFELDAGEVRHIESGDALLTSDHRPLPGETVDLRSLVTVRVNDAGMAEWAILGPNGRRSAAIESPAERRRLREEEAARNRALAKIDWSRSFDPWREPVLRYESSEGCGHVSVSALTSDRAEIISIRIDKRGLGLGAGVHTLDLSREQGVAVTVHMYDRPLRQSPFCTDVGMGPVDEQTWRAVRGTITIELSPPGVTARNPAFYRATIRIEGAEFVGAGGKHVRQSDPIVISALVGMMFG
jgi:hypothetical protein